MTQQNKTTHVLNAMAYGDALGFLRENTKTEVEGLAPFSLQYDDDLTLSLPRGQWSYITELMLILIKCLVDDKENWKVEIDYRRMDEELDLWQYYRHGTPYNILQRVGEGEQKNRSDLLGKDRRGWGMARMIPIVLANKNFNVVEEETYKNTVYFNRHPQVILTSLLMARSFYILLEEGKVEREGLIGELKNYLIHIRLQDLEQASYGQLTKPYILSFEKEKIDYLMDLDRLLKSWSVKEGDWTGKKTFLASIINYFYLCDENRIDFTLLPKEDQKESLSLSYGMWAIHQEPLPLSLEGLKDGAFIHNMGEYVGKLRSYEVGKKKYLPNPQETKLDIFRLAKGQMVKHPVLNVMKVRERLEEKGYVRLWVEAKSGTYHFITSQKK